jgi:DNA-directed RNA polymerase specialized sigma24 family protein
LRHNTVLRCESLDVESASNLCRSYSGAPFEDRVAEGEVLRAAHGDLGPQDAACLLLNVVQGFTAHEIAAILDTSPPAANKRLTRAKQRLREAYFARESGNPTPAEGPRP